MFGFSHSTHGTIPMEINQSKSMCNKINPNPCSPTVFQVQVQYFKHQGPSTFQVQIQYIKLS